MIKIKNEHWTSETIYSRILVLCEEYGWSINRLAEMAGVTPSTIYTYRYRESMPKVETLIVICNAFGISLSKFFRIEDDTANELYDVICGLSKSSRGLLKEVAKRMKS